MVINLKTARLACALLFIAVALGAFGAHGLKDHISPLALETWKTGNLYHFIHAGALLAAALLPLKSAWPTRLLLVGILIFSGCCYLYALTGIKVFGMIVPLGGLSFLAAWLKMALELRE